jgi:rubrerythrin
MADEKTKAPVTDSREPGFNPEVEESKAAAEKAAADAAAAAQGADPAAAPPPKYTHRCGACGGMFESLAQPCPSCGASDTMTEVKG